MTNLEIGNLDKFYGEVHAVKDLSLHIGSGEMFFLLGPSGSGKTTTLRSVAGLEDITSGTITLGGASIVDLEPGERDIGMVFQTFALFPTLSPRANVGFPLKILGLSRNEIHERVTRLAGYLGLEDLLDRSTAELSDGDKQRLAIARAIIRQPSLLLLDEPLTFLDAKLRMTLGAELRQLQRDLHLTGLYVTHDQAEAMTMGDRIGVMDQGVLHQVGSPAEVYDAPATTFTARFVGSPSMNILDGEITADGMLVSGALSTPLALSGCEGLAQPVLFGIRPEGLRAESGAGQLRIRVDFVEWLGGIAFVHGFHEDTRIVAQLGDDIEPRHGDLVNVAIAAERPHLFDPETERRIDVHVGWQAHVASA